MNQLLEDTTLHVVRNMVSKGELFTALDVSNKVKETLPMSRHRDVREIVRNIFASEIEPMGYTRTNIPVTLSNGDKMTALLYHPLTDSWDLDTKYGADRRAAEKPGFTKFGQNVTPVSQTVPVSQNVQVTQTVSVSQTVADLSPTDVWEQLFKSQPSLFPDK
jgi:hypothetical protein